MSSISSRDPAEGESTLETSFGEKFVFRDTAVDTGGELLRIDAVLDPGVRRPLHTHPKQDERFMVRSGTLGLAIEDRELYLEEGKEEIVTAGTPHTFWNAGGGKLHVTTEYRPALRFEEFIRAMVELDREDGLDSEGMPANPFVAAAIIDEFRDEMRPADVPVPIQRVLFPLLAKVGGVLGYGVPEYSTGEPESVSTERPP